MDFVEAKDDGDGGDNWSCKTCNAPVTSTPRAECPSRLPRKCNWALNDEDHIPRTCSPLIHVELFETCLWPLKSAGYLGGGLPRLSSALWRQYPTWLPVSVNQLTRRERERVLHNTIQTDNCFCFERFSTPLTHLRLLYRNSGLV